MGLLADQRSPRPRPRGVRGLAVIAAITVAAVVALVALPALIPSLNPFRDETRDRSGPALQKSLENLSEYRAASSNLQVVVDIERDSGLLPSFIKGKRTVMIAAGSVDAAVDFRALGRAKDAVRVSEDRKAVAIELPAARLTVPRLDQGESRVFDQDRGLVDRISDVFSDNPGDQQELYRRAEAKLGKAARADTALLRRAEDNTRKMLEGLMRALGFERITVRFAPPT